MGRLNYWKVILLMPFLVAGCVTAKAPDTGVTRLTTNCQDGARPLLDCTRDYEQYARTFRFDVGAIRRAAVGFGVGAQQLIQLDSITADLLAHKRQVCVEYNNCLLSGEEYTKEMAFLRRAQLKVREMASQFSSYGYPPGVGGPTEGSGEAPGSSRPFEELFTEMLRGLAPGVEISTPVSGVGN